MTNDSLPNHSEQIQWPISQGDLQNLLEKTALNLESISWQGRFLEDFLEFWGLFFYQERGFFDYLEDFQWLKNQLKLGPLCNWVSWLEEKFILHILEQKHYKIDEICHYENSKFNSIITQSIINHLNIQFPLQEEGIYDYFNRAVDRPSLLNYSINELISEIHLKKDNFVEDDLNDQMGQVCKELEVTLFLEWHEVLEKLKQSQRFNTKLRPGTKAKIPYVKGILEFILLTCTIALIIIGTKKIGLLQKNINKQQNIVFNYFKNSSQENLDQKIYQSNRPEVVNNSSFLDLEKLDKILQNQLFQQVEEAIQVYSPESDVLFSGDNAKKIEEADEDISLYEEINTKGFREDRYGRQVVYRVLTKAHNIEEIALKINDLLNKYQAEQFDHVRPGTVVPGGIYYNILIPQKWINDLLSEVTENLGAKIYQSTVNDRPTPGKSKIFIWIKSV